MRCMRTTVTLDPDVAEIVRRSMSERGISFKTAVNDAIRRSVPGPRARFTTPTVAMGAPRVDLDRALDVAGTLEDGHLVRKLQRGA